MEVVFLGVGEACDPLLGNTSLLVVAEDAQILLDCGFTVPHAYFRRRPPADGLAAVWISHFHGDHCFGLPLLLLRLAEMGRRRPLQVAGPPGLGRRAELLVDTAYPGCRRRLGYEIQYTEVTAGQEWTLAGRPATAVATDHSTTNLALRLAVGGGLFYSGDGRPTAASLALAGESRLVVHEAFAAGDTVPGHGNAQTLLDHLADGGRRLVLVHCGRDHRPAVAALVAGRPGVGLGNDGDVVGL